jgi:hypothetical protein
VLFLELHIICALVYFATRVYACKSAKRAGFDEFRGIALRLCYTVGLCSNIAPSAFRQSLQVLAFLAEELGFGVPQYNAHLSSVKYCNTSINCRILATLFETLLLRQQTQHPSGCSQK